MYTKKIFWIKSTTSASQHFSDQSILDTRTLFMFHYTVVTALFATINFNAKSLSCKYAVHLPTLLQSTKYINRFKIIAWVTITALIICFFTPPTLAYRMNLTYITATEDASFLCSAWVCQTVHTHLSLPVCKIQAITSLLNVCHMEIIKVPLNKWLCVITSHGGFKNVLTTTVSVFACRLTSPTSLLLWTVTRLWLYRRGVFAPSFSQESRKGGGLSTSLLSQGYQPPAWIVTYNDDNWITEAPLYCIFRGNLFYRSSLELDNYL
jgi:hypothetical protein